MRIFMNNVYVDVMDYMELDLITEDTHSKHGQTYDEIKLDIRVDDGNSSTKQLDIFVLKNAADQKCYEEVV